MENGELRTPETSMNDNIILHLCIQYEQRTQKNINDANHQRHICYSIYLYRHFALSKIIGSFNFQNILGFHPTFSHQGND